MRRLATSILILGLAFLSGCETAVREGDWDNPHDPNGTAYFPPLVGLRDTSIRDGDSGVVLSLARGQGAVVESCLWTLDDAPLDTRDCSIPTKGWTIGIHVVKVVAIDVRGVRSASATANVRIGNQPPRIGLVEDQRVPAHWPFGWHLLASDPDGWGVSIQWDTVPDRYGISTSQVDLAQRPEGGSRRVYWRAIDSDGAVETSSFEVRHLPNAVVEVRPNGYHPDIVSVLGGQGSWTAKLKPGANMPLVVTAAIPGFSDEVLDVSTWNIPCTRAENPDGVIVKEGDYLCSAPQNASFQYEVSAVDALDRVNSGRAYISSN